LPQPPPPLRSVALEAGLSHHTWSLEELVGTLTGAVAGAAA